MGCMGRNMPLILCTMCCPQANPNNLVMPVNVNAPKNENVFNATNTQVSQQAGRACMAVTSSAVQGQELCSGLADPPPPPKKNPGPTPFPLEALPSLC